MDRSSVGVSGLCQSVCWRVDVRPLAQKLHIVKGTFSLGMTQ